MGISCCSGKNDVYRSFYHQQSEQFFDNYTLGKTIGRGSSGEVKIAYHNITHKKVAIKIFDKADVIKSSSFQHIMSQKMALQELSFNNKFPFVLKLIQCAQDQANLYMILEFFENGNLRKLMQTKKSFNSQQLRFVTICLLLTLNFLNKKRIIHGDIKPENILIDENGYCCVADFSSAKYYGCQNLQIFGTKKYRAPQLTAEISTKLVDNRSDLYSLGAVLWEMAYGIRYWQYLHARNKEMEQSEETNDSVSENCVNQFVEDLLFNDFVQKLLKENPTQRPSLQSMVEHPWLNLTPQLQKSFIEKRVSLHPFQPLNEYFCYRNKQQGLIMSKVNRDSLQCGDELFRSVLLNQRKYQQMFSQFTRKQKSTDHSKNENYHI